MPTSSRPRRAAPRRPFVVAIDGPAGAGKSTVAKGVARDLHFAHLDTGAMYRALTAKALRESIDPSDGAALTALAKRTVMDFGPDGLLVDGLPVGREARAPKVNRAVSAVSAHGGVRKELIRHQRAILGKGDVVAEGRDIGTVVAPYAPVKVFLTASIDERARRRHREMTDGGVVVSLPTLKEELVRRDTVDSSRSLSPLVAASDAIEIDTSDKTPRQVVEEVLSIVRTRRQDR